MIADLETETRRGILPSSGAVGSDPLTALLEPCRYQTRISRPWQLTAPWGLECAEATAGFLLLLDGACVLDLPDEQIHWSLQAPQLAIFTRPNHVRVVDRDGSAVAPVSSLLQVGEQADPIRRIPAAGALTRFICGSLTQDDDYTRQAFALLPPVVVLKGAISGNGWYRPFVDVLLEESAQGLPGGRLVCSHVLDFFLIQALRQTLAQASDFGSGLLAALRVPGLGAALGSMHTRPDHDWSVEELAEMAGLSRAAFAARFLETIGSPPFQYLRDVRMRLAGRLLRDTEKGVKEVATRVGYSTEASFSKAFTRWCGHAPGVYRRRSRTQRD